MLFNKVLILLLLFVGISLYVLEGQPKLLREVAIRSHLLYLIDRALQLVLKLVVSGLVFSNGVLCFPQSDLGGPHLLLKLVEAPLHFFEFLNLLGLLIDFDFGLLQLLVLYAQVPIQHLSITIDFDDRVLRLPQLPLLFQQALLAVLQFAFHLV